jgi:peptide deformylase
MFEDLKIIFWPDPRLSKVSLNVEKFDLRLSALAQKMFQLLRDVRGVGLAAPQVGHNIRMFVTNSTGQPQDARVYVNPEMTDLDGQQESEEGCLSLPGVNVKILRGKSARLQAQDLAGTTFQQSETGYVARIWQHEMDHLNGTLLTDRMGAVAKLASRKTLKDLREQYATQQSTPGKKIKNAL